jgi:hypothetical protein
VVAKGVSPPAWTSIDRIPFLPLQEHKARLKLTAPYVFSTRISKESLWFTAQALWKNHL